MVNILNKFKENLEKEMIKQKAEFIVKDFKKEEAYKTYKTYRNSTLIILIILLVISVITLFKWKLVGIIILILSSIYAISCFISYSKFKRTWLGK